MFGSFVMGILIVLLIAVCLIVLAHGKKSILGFVSRLMHIFISPFEWLLHAITHVLQEMGKLLHTVLHDLRHRLGDDEHAWAGWAVVTSFCSLILFLALATCDFFNALVKLVPIVGWPIPYDPGVFSYSLGISFVLAFLVIGWGMAEVFELAPVNSFKRLGVREMRRLRWLMFGSLLLALLTTVLLMLLVTEAHAGPVEESLFAAFLCCYSILMFLATLLAGLSFFAGITSVYILVLGAVRLVVWLVGCILYLPYRLLLVVHDMLGHLLTLFATVGAVLSKRLLPQYPVDEQPELPVMEVVELPSLSTQLFLPPDAKQNPSEETGLLSGGVCQ